MIGREQRCCVDCHLSKDECSVHCERPRAPRQPVIPAKKEATR